MRKGDGTFGKRFRNQQKTIKIVSFLKNDANAPLFFIEKPDWSKNICHSNHTNINRKCAKYFKTKVNKE